MAGVCSVDDPIRVGHHLRGVEEPEEALILLDLATRRPKHVHGRLEPLTRAMRLLYMLCHTTEYTHLLPSPLVPLVLDFDHCEVSHELALPLQGSRWPNLSKEMRIRS